MTLLRLVWHFGVRAGLALWLLPEIEAAHKGFFWQEDPHESWTA